MTPLNGGFWAIEQAALLRSAPTLACFLTNSTANRPMDHVCIWVKGLLLVAENSILPQTAKWQFAELHQQVLCVYTSCRMNGISGEKNVS